MASALRLTVGRLRRRLRRAVRSTASRWRTDAIEPDRPVAPAERDFILELPTPEREAGRSSRDRLRIRTPAHLYVPKRLEESGLARYEPETMSCYLAATEVVPPGAVFDVGANVGVFALVAAALGDREVVAFEPTPQLAATARELAGLNGLQCRVEECALGSQRGTATLYLSDVTDSSNSLRAGFRRSSREVTVGVETLDEYVRSTGIHPAVIKLDTESTEPDVLAGSLDVLQSHRPWIICEVLAGRTEDALMALLGPFKYAWYHITDAQPFSRRDTIAGDPTYQAMNWLFAPEAPSEAFWRARERWLDALLRTAPRHN